MQPRTLPVSALHPPNQQPESVDSANGSSNASQAPGQSSVAQASAHLPVQTAAQAGIQLPAGQPEVVKKKRGRPRKHPIAGALSPAAPVTSAEMQHQAAPGRPVASDSAPPTQAATHSPPAAYLQASEAPAQSAEPQTHAQIQAIAAAAPSGAASPLDHVKALAAAMHTKYAQNSQADTAEASADQASTEASHGHARQGATRWDLLNQVAEAQELHGVVHQPNMAFASLDRQAAYEVASALNHDDASATAFAQPGDRQQPGGVDAAEQPSGAALSRPGPSGLPIEMLLREGQGRKKRVKKTAANAKAAGQAAAKSAANSAAATAGGADAGDTATDELAPPEAAVQASEHAARKAAAAAAHSLLHDLSAKKRRGRPPKDPMKLAAALAAYAAPRAAAAAAAAQAASEAADAEIIAQAAAQAGLDVVEQYTQRHNQYQADQNRLDAFGLPPGMSVQPRHKRPQPEADGSATWAFENAGNADSMTDAPKPKKKRGRPPKVVMQASMKTTDAAGMPSHARSAPARQTEATPATAPAQAALLAAAAAAAAQAEELMNRDMTAGGSAPATSLPEAGRQSAVLHAEALYDSQQVSGAMPQAQHAPELMHRTHAAPEQRTATVPAPSLPMTVEVPAPEAAAVTAATTASALDHRQEAAATESTQLQPDSQKPKRPRSQQKQLEVLSSRALTILNSLAHNGIAPSSAPGALATSAELLSMSTHNPDNPPQSGYPSNFSQWQVGALLHTDQLPCTLTPYLRLSSVFCSFSCCA